MTLYYLNIFLKLAIFITIVNVWFFRFNKPTPYRGGSAKSMKEEFQVYGIGNSFMYLIGFLKVVFASLLVVSIWYPDFSIPSAIGMGVLMLGAIFMHFKANDPSIRSFPALTLFIMSLAIVVLATFEFA